MTDDAVLGRPSCCRCLAKARSSISSNSWTIAHRTRSPEKSAGACGRTRPGTWPSGSPTCAVSRKWTARCSAGCVPRSSAATTRLPRRRASTRTSSTFRLTDGDPLRLDVSVPAAYRQVLDAWPRAPPGSATACTQTNSMLRSAASWARTRHRCPVGWQAMVTPAKPPAAALPAAQSSAAPRFQAKARAADHSRPPSTGLVYPTRM
jgi:hypothetical protein